MRILLTARIMRRELDQTVHREAVLPIRLNRRVIDERTLRAVSVFVLLYLVAFALGALVLVIDGARGAVDVSPFEAISAAATTLGNVGPGFGFLGPMGSFEPFSQPLDRSHDDAHVDGAARTAPHRGPSHPQLPARVSTRAARPQSVL